MSKDTYNILLNKLLAGTITSQEKWQLEKASLDDPFLADAIEGYYDNEGKSSDIKDLIEQIKPAKKETKSRSLLFRRLSVAASLLALMAASFWMFQKTEPQMTAAKSTTRSQPVQQDKVSISGNTAGASKSSRAINDAEEQSEIIIADNATKETSSQDELDTKPQISPPPQPVTKTKKALPEASPVPNTKATAQKTTESADLETLIEQEENRPEAVMDEVVTTDLDDLSNENRKGNIYKVEEVNKAKAKTKATTETKEEVVYVDGVKIKKAETTGNFSQVATPTLPPRIKTGIVRSSEGRPLKGVTILDSKSNPIATTDDKGQFNLPSDLGYVVTSFTGYDSETVAVTDELTIELRPTAEALSERHMRLIDQMTDTEVQRYYINKLNEVFSRNWPICKRESQIPIVTNAGRPEQFSNIPSHLSVTLKINEHGQIDDIGYFQNLPEQCAASISDVFSEAVANEVFESGRPIEFRYRINL